MLFRILSIFLVIGWLIGTAQSKPLLLNEAKDISQFGDIAGYGPIDNALIESPGTIEAEIVEANNDEGSLVKIEGLGYRTVPNTPMIPQKNIHLQLPGHYQISSVTLDHGQVRPGHTNGKIIPAPLNPKIEEKMSAASANRDVYSENAYFPAKWLSYTAGYDGQTTHIYIHLFPVQWNPVTYDLLYLYDYSLSVYGQPRQITVDHSRNIRTNAEHLLITPAAWLSTVDSIAAFDNSLGIATDVITTDSIYAAYEPCEDPTVPGDTTHDFENAKRLVSYLRDDQAHPQLQSLTIIGSGEIIPPSYYFYCYESICPSDQYYASPDYDWVDNFAATRIPVHTESDLSTYYHKMLNWTNELDGDWVNNVSVGGEALFSNSIPSGEAHDNQLICADVFDGFNIAKFQMTLQNYSAGIISNHLQNDDFLWYFQASHGGDYGRSIYFRDLEYVTELSSESLMMYQPKSRLPIFLTYACETGFYDHALLDSSDIGKSFSEGLIASPGGAICYIGTSRDAYGDLLKEIERGNLRYLGVRGTFALIYYYLQSYREIDNPTLGNLALAAKEKYLIEQDMEDPFVQEGYKRFVIHCDGALALPQPPPLNPQTTVPDIEAENAREEIYLIYQVADYPDSLEPHYLIADDNVYDLISITYGPEPQEITSIDYSSAQSDFYLPGFHGWRRFLNKLNNEEQKEAWHISYINSWLKIFDGDPSDWSAQEQIGSDEAGEITPSFFDLTSVYATYYEAYDELYFALPLNFNLADVDEAIWPIYYMIAFDDAPYGFQNNYEDDDELPINTDIYLGFENATINKFIYMRIGHIYSGLTFNAHYRVMNESNEWGFGHLPTFAISDSLFEVVVSAEQFDLTNCKMAVFSTADEGIIEDVIPFSPGSPSEALFGPENAYSISNYIDFGQALAIEPQATADLSGFQLEQNYPNPWLANRSKSSQHTTIAFLLAHPTKLELNIYDLAGRRVKSLAGDKIWTAGHHSINWNGADDKGKAVASGIYFYRLKSDGEVVTKKMLILR